MQLMKLTVVALFLVTRICRAKSAITTPNPDESSSRLVQDLVILNEGETVNSYYTAHWQYFHCGSFYKSEKKLHMHVVIKVNILMSCYKNRISGIGVAGNMSGTLLRSLSTQHLIPMILFDNPSNVRKIPPRVPVRFRRKLQFFIVETSSWEVFDDIIEENIEYSIWWNHMASVFILDESPNCGNAATLLLAAWYSNILNAKVICYGYDSRTNVVSYNPFTSVAPASWQRVDVVPGIDEHPFTVFSREYTGNESVCVDLDYEKTKDLGGYRILMQGSPLGNYEYNKKYLSTYQFWRTHDRILHTIYRAMNSTPRFSDHYSPDMDVTPRWMPFTWDYNTLITYPHEQTGLVLISQFRGHKSQWNKIISLIDTYSRYGLAIVYLITLMFFKFFVGQALMPALLNLTRITSGTGFLNLPVNTASRIYLTSLLFFALTILGIFQSGLASLLTKKIPLRNVETIKDVVTFDYHMFGSPGAKYLIELPDVEKRYIDINEPYDCIMHVKHDSSAVCIWYAKATALDGARYYNLHVSNHFVVPIYLGFQIRWNWALEERVNIILGKMVEADVLQPWEAKCNPTKLSDFQFDEEVKKNTTHKVLELSELLFAFVFLSIGIACATIVFIVELAIHRFHIRIVSNVRVQILT